MVNALLETERLNSLIDNVLLVSRMDKHHLTLNKEKVNLSELVLKTLNRYFEKFIEKGELKMEVENEIFINTDPLLFPSVVINLVENAIKYSFGEVDVVLQLMRKGDGLELIVSDQGTGIRESDKPYVFNRFYRSGNEEIRSTKGTGIGLFIVKQMMEAQGGKVRIENNIPKGSIFILNFR